jgi:spectinomycin phosphotransferase
VIERPNITDKRIISALREAYSIAGPAIQFLPLGCDPAAWAYRVQSGKDTYFLKIRKAIQNPAGIFMPAYLQEQGMDQVMAPLSSTKGKTWEKVDDFFFCLYPFIVGHGVKNVGMSDAHWVELGSILNRLHATKLPPYLLNQIRRESFVPMWMNRVIEFHAQLKSYECGDAFHKELAEFWREKYATISTILERTETLAKRMQAIHWEFVPCHADIHTANLMITEDDRMFIIDWDEVMLAPKERDLMFMVGDIGERATEFFFKGYGGTEVNALALAYYRYDWCVEDLGSFAEDVFRSKTVGELTKRDSIRWIRNQFAPGNTVESALSTAINI